MEKCPQLPTFLKLRFYEKYIYTYGFVFSIKTPPTSEKERGMLVRGVFPYGVLDYTGHGILKIMPGVFE